MRRSGGAQRLYDGCMARRLVPVVAFVLAGCSAGEPEPVPASCFSDAEVYAQALEAAPEPVRLPDGSAISSCVQLASQPADLQNLGAVVTRVADRLAAQAEEDPRAALELGYLVGAVQRGAERTNGTQLELAFRTGRSAGRLGTPPPEVARALELGLAAGERSG